MPEKRFYHPFTEKEKIILEGKEHHHLAKVMRCKEGETVELINGKNQIANALVKSIQKKTELQITEIETTPPPEPLILMQALIHLPRLEWLIEKAVEVGATELHLFPADRSVKKSLSENQLERLRNITISAMKQCGRLDLPLIQILPPLAKCKLPPLLFGDFEGGKIQNKFLHFVIGPESGFSPAELALLRSNGQGIRLHSNILRAETAAITALIQLQN